MTRRSVFAFLGTAIAAVASFRPLSALQRRPLARGPLLPGAHAPGSPVVRRAATPAGVGAASLPRRRPPLTPRSGKAGGLHQAEIHPTPVPLGRSRSSIPGALTARR